MSWPVEIDGRDYYPVPESWVEHGSDHASGSPRVFAVSVASSVRDMIRLRYATVDGRVYEVTTSGAENPTGGGTVPASLAKSGDWPRSLVPRDYVDSTDVLRSVESEHLEDLWSDRVERLDEPDAARPTGQRGETA